MQECRVPSTDAMLSLSPPLTVRKLKLHIKIIIKVEKVDQKSWKSSFAFPTKRCVQVQLQNPKLTCLLPLSHTAEKSVGAFEGGCLCCCVF